MGKLVQLEVFNFKSYRGHHVLLFGDSYFTSVIGPNGSGKSNSMDAISFALGIKSSHLRSTNLRDLIYRGRVIRTAKINADGTATEANGDGDGATPENGGSQLGSSQRHDPKFAWVKAVFEDDAEQMHEWKRTITSSGQSEYRINDRVVSQKEYIDALEEQSILIKARNFLVFQGDVEKVASQDPKALTNMVEQISGSIEYKAEYERLQDESERALEEQTDQLRAKREIGQEVKTYEAAKAEAEEYERKVQGRDQAIVTHVLWKLFHFQQTIQKSSDEIAKHQEELKEHKRGVEKYYQKLEEAKQAQAKVSREVSKTEKNIKAKEKEIEDAENSLVPIDEKIKIASRDVQKYKDRTASLQKDRETQDQLVQRYKKDLATVQRAQEKFEDDFKAKAQQEGRELSEQDLEEYSRLRREVTNRTTASRIETDTLERQVKTDEGTVKNLREKIETMERQVQKLNEEISELTNRQRELNTRSTDMERDRAAKQHALNKMRSDRQAVHQKYTEINEMLQDTLRKLNEAEGGRRQNEKERRIRETVQQMKRTFAGRVHGRYRDLCHPKQRKYDTAVSTLLGWHLDAIIVDTDTTARECIQYLKDQKLGQFTFIPLDTIAIKAVNQNLKGMHKGMRLGIDCIDYDPALERAMASACGNSIICDDMKVAKYLCYERGVDAKAVTLDGTVIAKAGTITGGRLPSDNRGSAFSDAQVEQLVKLKDRQMEQLAALPKNVDRPSPEEEGLYSDILDLDYRIRSAQDELRSLDRNIQDKKKELGFQRRQLREQQPKYQDAAQRLQNRTDELGRYQDAVNQVADEVFAAFCQRLGYASIRDYESQQGTMQQEAAESRLEFGKQRSRLLNQLQFHEQQLKSIDERIQALNEKASRDEALIKDLEAEKDELQNNMDVLNAELERFKETLSDLRDKLSERASVVNEQRRELDKRNGKVKDVMKDIDALEADIKRTASSRYTLLRKCRVEEINIPLAEGSASLQQLPMGDVGGADPDAMDVDDDPDSTQIQQQPEVDDYGIEVDFDDLDDNLKEDDTSATETMLTERIAALSSDIQSANPNMKARDRLTTSEAKLKDIQREFERARKDASRKKQDFETVKQKRLDLFNKAFNHISENIGGTYKDLTKSPQFPLGGQAYLDMEDSNEPYLAGLKYHAMPPLKRFRDMEHLSGGEKTIAALALLFAIHSYQPSPFFVLDEVDAALDNVNVGRVAKYVREHASPGMQFIVISLKSGLFQESESLVGVMRDQSKMSSRVVSLDVSFPSPLANLVFGAFFADFFPRS
ncbi:putative cohesin complex subunit [Lojkania enalia]|uniref:Structural maintenance of chromosomes protein n=1 Tax=Lojkania enalia TaxID=147567 RepID=A0A9P4TS72_9PLEO|nr:putative cohesin complex subunit [Didymosphaeria enalia]